MGRFPIKTLKVVCRHQNPFKTLKLACDRHAKLKVASKVAKQLDPLTALALRTPAVDGGSEQPNGIHARPLKAAASAAGASSEDDL